jgi:hypothetical protein
MSWIDLGEIIRVSQAYRKDLDGYEWRSAAGDLA